MREGRTREKGGESIGSKKEKREKCMLGMKELGLTPLLYALF